MVWLSIAAGIVIAFLGWNLFRRFGADRITELTERRRGSSLIVSRGELVDGNRHLEVVLSLTQSTFFYENADLEASLDLQWVRDIEYDTELVTGGVVRHGRVLRLRCYSQTFEFVLPNDVVSRWYTMLPPRRTEAPVLTAQAVPAT